MSNKVSDWLNKIEMGQYSDAFSKNAIDWEILPDLDQQFLKAIGVTIVGHQIRILKAVKAIQVERTAQPSVKSRHQFKPEIKPSQSSEASKGERRQLTVMFCDLVGSTALSESMDPENYRDILTTFRSTTAKQINYYDGHIAHYMGDGLLVYFGYPQAHEDDAERAIRTGLAIITALSNLDVVNDKLLEVRIGIATGLVVAGDIIAEGTSEERAVLGDTPNLAARLQTVANPNEIVISDSTRRLLPGFFELEALGDLDLKGISAPVKPFRVTGERHSETRFAALHAVPATLMEGRKHELALLSDRWQKAKYGEGQVVVLTGEAGIGKSRLTSALCEAVSPEDHKRVMIQCSPYHIDSPLYPVIQQLIMTAEIDTGDTLEQKREKLDAILQCEQRNSQDTSVLLSELPGLQKSTDSHTASLDISSYQKRERTLQVLVQHYTDRIDEKPALFVMEDAHWADPTTLEFLTLLAAKIESCRIMFLITARPPFHHKFGGHPIVSMLALNRLGLSSTISVIEHITRGKSLPKALLDEIVAKTDGVPLYIEEFTKTLLDSGQLRESDVDFSFTSKFERVQVPSSLQDSLMARLDRFESIKEVAQTAACIGREFGKKLLGTITTLPETDLQAALDQLVSAELIFRRGEPNDEIYSFKHALVRDAAYESLLNSKKIALHSAIVSSLESNKFSNSTERPETLALHAYQGEQWSKAIKYLRASASTAIQHSAYAEARSHLETALKALDHLPETRENSLLEVDIRLEIRPALGAIGHYRDILNNLETAKWLAQRIGNKNRLAGILADKTHVLYQLGRCKDAVSVGMESVNAAKAAGDHRYLAQASANLAQTHFFCGNLNKAIELLDPFVEELQYEWRHERIGTTATSSCLWLANRCGILAECGRFDEACKFGKIACDIASESAQPFDTAVSLGWSGHLLTRMGEFESARSRLEKAHEVTIENGLDFMRVWTGFYLGAVLNETAQYRSAHEILVNNLESCTSMDLVVVSLWTRVQLAFSSLGLDNKDVAEQHCLEALATIDSTGIQWAKPAALLFLAKSTRSLAGTKTIDKSIDLISQAADLCRIQSALPMLAHCKHELGVHYLAQGDWTQAINSLDSAKSILMNLGMQHWLPRTSEELEKATSHSA